MDHSTGEQKSEIGKVQGYAIVSHKTCSNKLRLKKKVLQRTKDYEVQSNVTEPKFSLIILFQV